MNSDNDLKKMKKIWLKLSEIENKIATDANERNIYNNFKNFKSLQFNFEKNSDCNKNLSKHVSNASSSSLTKCISDDEIKHSAEREKNVDYMHDENSDEKFKFQSCENLSGYSASESDMSITPPKQCPGSSKIKLGENVVHGVIAKQTKCANLRKKSFRRHEKDSNKRSIYINKSKHTETPSSKDSHILKVEFDCLNLIKQSDYDLCTIMDQDIYNTNNARPQKNLDCEFINKMIKLPTNEHDERIIEGNVEKKIKPSEMTCGETGSLYHTKKSERKIKNLKILCSKNLKTYSKFCTNESSYDNKNVSKEVRKHRRTFINLHQHTDYCSKDMDKSSSETDVSSKSSENEDDVVSNQDLYDFCKNDEDVDMKEFSNRENNDEAEDGNESIAIIDSTHLTKDELETLKGDAVGNTAHSGRWIIRTMMSLCEICNDKDFTEELEENLCMLWDMTMDDDIKSYLISNNFFDISRHILTTCRNTRLIEIIIGIIANICCNNFDALDLISTDEALAIVILNYLTTSDTKLLIQIVRLLQAIVWRIWWNEESKWIIYLNKTDLLWMSLTNMLFSSSNGDLLWQVIILLQSIFDSKDMIHTRFLADSFFIDNLMSALIECFTEIIKSEEDEFSAKDMKFITNWLDVVENINPSKYFQADNDEYNIIPNMMNILNRILKRYNSCLLLPMQKEDFSVICSSVNIMFGFYNFNSAVSQNINYNLMSLTYKLQEEVECTVLTKDARMHDVLSFMNNYWLRIFQNCTKTQLSKIFFMSTLEFRKYVVNIIRRDSDKSPELLEKIRIINISS